MRKNIVLLFYCIFLCFSNYAQIMPTDGCKLNYRMVGFRIPTTLNAVDYKIEIASGNFSSLDSFKKHVIKIIPVNNNKVIGDVPYFGMQYTWCYSYSLSKETVYSHLQHFSTTSAPEVDTNSVRLRIIQPALKYKDDYVFLDDNKALYDMNGRPVWYLTGLQKLVNYGLPIDSLVSDLKLSSHNSITFLFKGQAYEIDYNGNILWVGPNNGVVSGDTTEHYHHEFTHLDNGHYMVLGRQFNWKFPSAKDSILFTDTSSRDNERHNVEFGTLIEYDQKGNIVWSWKSSKYFLEEDRTFIKPIRRFYSKLSYDFVHPKIKKLQEDVHENGFFFDEKNNIIYLSFKNISTILKINYPEGIVLNVYGSPINTNNPNEANLFCHQHSCRISQDGYLYLFNNNLCDTSPAKVTIMREPLGKSNALQKVWEYQCTVEGSYARRFFSGGNVLELPDRSIFISMGSVYSKILIVGHDKKVLWSAMPEKWNQSTMNWEIVHQSKSAIISQKQLEDLIWNSEINNKM